MLKWMAFVPILAALLLAAHGQTQLLESPGFCNWTTGEGCTLGTGVGAVSVEDTAGTVDLDGVENLVFDQNMIVDKGVVGGKVTVRVQNAKTYTFFGSWNDDAIVAPEFAPPCGSQSTQQVTLLGRLRFFILGAGEELARCPMPEGGVSISKFLVVLQKAADGITQDCNINLCRGSTYSSSLSGCSEIAPAIQIGPTSDNSAVCTHKGVADEMSGEGQYCQVNFDPGEIVLKWFTIKVSDRTTASCLTDLAFSAFVEASALEWDL